MAGGNKRKKFHDKDKYYRLAKEQGLRSRAAFKLSQIHRQHPVLLDSQNKRSAQSKAPTGQGTCVLDLCAAPGGWTQIAARLCDSNTQIVAVDVLPIRSLGLGNVKTLVGDITTQECHAKIRQTVASRAVHVVLHDGAPNVGADYGKDAYVQNELALSALKCAVQHLQHGGSFVTKLYRSRDYHAYHWVLQQLFGAVHTVKPAASRPQSAEIFLVALGYKAPTKLDPRLLDPAHVFASVDENHADSGNNNNALLHNNMTIFHRQWATPRRKRSGYDHSHLDGTLRHEEPVTQFCQSKSVKEAIHILSRSTGLVFACDTCKDAAAKTEAQSCRCQFLHDHPFTTAEIKECLADLQVLNKTDFKGLLNWRTKMQDALEATQQTTGTDDNNSMEAEDTGSSDHDYDDDDEDAIQMEIAEMRARRLRERKRRKKKERAVAAKRRRRRVPGLESILDEDDEHTMFSLASIPNRKALEAASEVNLDQVTEEPVVEDQDVVVGSDSEDDLDSDDEDALATQRERNLDEAYHMYLQTTKDGLAKSGTKMAKRSKKVQRQKVLEEAQEDQEMAMTGNVSQETRAYAKLLQRGGDSDADNDDERSADDEDDGFFDEPLTPAEYTKSKMTKAPSNPLIHSFADESTSMKTARWFSNPLFASIGQAAQSVTAESSKVVAIENDGDEDDEKMTAEDILASMPKTDKQKRHEKRLKQRERDERKQARRARKLGESEKDFQLVAHDDYKEEERSTGPIMDHLSEAQKKKIVEARKLIKAGMGQSSAATEGTEDKRLEIVAQNAPVPRIDDRRYDSEHEDYDSDDYAETLALGTMMLRKSKEKAFVDASYNRYAWNDPSDLPEWFVDDETKHYRPQLPIPPTLMAKMKQQLLALSVKPIAKVAEARARKNKRAKLKLAAAKKKAEAVANSSEMTESMKLKAISKALRGHEAKRPGRAYIVAKKGRNNGVKGAKLVDKRMKSDKRAMNRTEKKRKKGKQNKMVGSKKRRLHS